MKLINADELDKVKFHPLPYTHITPSDADAESYKRGWNDAIDAIMSEAPTIEERKTGKWTPKENRPKQEVFICSECGGWAYSPWIGSRKTPKPNKCKYSYCPNCGARMSE